MTRRTPAESAAFVISTWFGCGYFPVGPGTAGSLAALLIASILRTQFAWGRLEFALLAGIFLLPAIWSAGVSAAAFGKKDPGFVVVDEVIGQWVTLAGATAWNWKSWCGAFLLFRLFDIWKPVPVRNLEALPGGLGIVADDVMAGIYAALVLYAAGCFNLY